MAQLLSSEFDSSLVEVRDTASYFQMTRFLVRYQMARGEEKTTTTPVSVDVSGYALVVFGSPVWAFKPTPVNHSAIDRLDGCVGKSAVAFSTNGGRPGQMDDTFIKWIEARGMVPSAINIPSMILKIRRGYKTSSPLFALQEKAKIIRYFFN